MVPGVLWQSVFSGVLQVINTNAMASYKCSEKARINQSSVLWLSRSLSSFRLKSQPFYSWIEESATHHGHQLSCKHITVDISWHGECQSKRKSPLTCVLYVNFFSVLACWACWGLVGWLVSWCFEPSQLLGITSGLCWGYIYYCEMLFRSGSKRVVNFPW